MSAVDDAIAELDTALVTLGPQYEGLRDFTRLNIQPDTLKAVQELLLAYDRRVGLVSSVRDLLERLRGDGYPLLDLRAVTAAVYADLANQEATIAAALALFTSDPAAKLSLTAGAVGPK